jgi:shikimate dehydrogenase
MHNAAMQEMQMDAIYLAFDVPPERLLGLLPTFRELGFGGLNLTVPLKEIAFRGLTELDDLARKLGAVNTIEFRAEGVIKGHNTDGYGFLRAIRESFGTGVRDLKIFILGCGGAGRAVAITCAMEGARRIVLKDADRTRATRLYDEIRKPFGATCTVELAGDTPAGLDPSIHDCDLVVQATPIGMRREDPSPLPATAFRRDQMVYDLVYMYPETDLMRQARKAGARAENGLGMLLHQGARALSIWTGVEPPIHTMRHALEREVYPASP